VLILKCCHYCQIIRKAFYEKKSVTFKSCDVDLVTETDQAVEKLLMTRIHENFPDHKYNRYISIKVIQLNLNVHIVID